MDRRAFVRSSLAASLASATGVGISFIGLQEAIAGGAAVTGSVIPEHPRLMLRDFDGVRALITSNERAASWYAKVKADADKILTLPVSKYVIPDGLRLLDTSREVVRRAYSLALAYGVENSSGYTDRLWAEMNAVAQFPDWNSRRHFLDTAEMTHAVAIAYDWLYHQWTPSQRSTMQIAMREFGLKPGLAVYASGSGWPTQTNNWNIVCNSGLALGALALAQDEPEISQQILDKALGSIPLAIGEYAPDGGYPEGLGSYWGYATKYLVPYIEALTTATGSDHSLGESAGLSETGFFPIYLTGPTGENFNYYDAGGGSPQPPEMFWLARRYGDPVFGWWGGLGADKNPVSWFQSPACLLWFDPSKVQTPIQAGLPLDKSFGRCEVATMRSGWEDRNAAFTGFKAGDNTTNHGDLDLGDFVFEVAGVRWAVELGSDNYNMPGYFAGGPGGQRWTYYRKRAEGQNTLIVNPGKGEDQVVRSAGAVVARASGPSAAYAVADLTEASAALTSWRRGVRQFDNRQQLVVQDELTAAEPVETWWFMHSSAVIAVADDGRSATLERSGQQLLARITSPAGAVFYNAAARPLWTSPDPEAQADITGLRKLAIRLRDVTQARLTVQLTPVRPGQETPAPAPVTALSDWDAGPPKVALLKSLTVGGHPVQAFAASTFVYTVPLEADADVPAVRAEPASSRGQVTVRPAKALPGVTTVDVTEPGMARSRYRIFMTKLAGLGSFPSTIIASTDDGNVPENTMDGDPATRWSADGDGQWIGYDLGGDGPVEGVTIAWYQGDKRSSTFDVEVAAAAETAWRTVFSGSSSGTSTAAETYSFDRVTARYVRIVGHGNSANAWNSITEVTIPGRAVELPEVEPYLESVTVHAPDSVQLGARVPVEVTGTMSDGTAADLSGADLTYATDDPAVATISADGTLTAVSEGTVSVAGIVVTDTDWRLEYGRKTVTVDDPDTSRFQAAADTYVNDGANADTNYGTASTLLVKVAEPAGSGFNRQAYLRFEPTPVSRTIESVTLELHASVADSQGTEIDLYVHRLAGGFDEKTVTWNTRPQLGAELGSVHVTSTSGWYSVDLTEQLRASLEAGTAIDLGLVQHPVAGKPGLATQVRSRESGRPPHLYVRLSG